MRLDSLTRPELIFLEIPGSDGPTVLQALALKVAEAAGLEDGQRVYRKLLEREQLGSTGIGDGVAIPHCKLAELREPLLAIGISREPIEFGALDGKPVRLFLLILSPAEPPAVHLKALATVSRWVKETHPAAAILSSGSPQAVSAVLETAPEI